MIEPWKIVVCVTGGWLIPVTWAIMNFTIKGYYERKKHTELLERLLKK